jgi:UDP-glucose 4-epimerase
MKILVTGGAGFIGTNLIKRLLKEGHNVTSIDNYSTGLTSNHVKGAVYVEFDLTNLDERFTSSPKKYDVVFHLAAIARIQPSFERPEDYFNTNATATLKLAKLCADNNIPMVYAGSSSHHSGKFKNPYTFSKDVGEEVIKLFQIHYNLQASVARFYNVYGPNHLKEGGYTTLIGAWERRLELGLPLVINGDGSKRRDFTHVSDIVDGLVKIVEKQAWGLSFELGRGKNYSVMEIAEAFEGEVVFAEDKPGEAQETLCQDLLAKKLLGWSPELDIIEYIKEYKKTKNERL